MRLYSRDQTQTASPPPAQGGIRIAERERPVIAHDAVHVTREAETTRVDPHAEFSVENVFNPTSLKAPPARPGYVQRWVADGTNPTSDKSEQRNWFAKTRAGWACRDPETVPPALRRLYPSAKLGDGQTAIRVASQVLCEMPLAAARARAAAVRDRVQHQSSSVPDSAKEKLRQSRMKGVSPELQVEDRVEAIRGRLAPTMAG